MVDLLNFKDMTTPMRDIDEIISSLGRTYPGLTHAQLRVRHPGADDDGLWFFRHADCPFEVQLESASGHCPFLCESGGSSAHTLALTVQEAVAWVAANLGLASTPTVDPPRLDHHSRAAGVEEEPDEFLTAAGNTEVPAYLALKALGLDVERRLLDDTTQLWIARKGQVQFSANSLLELLGLHAIRSLRGPLWMANDQEIDDFLRQYHPDAPG